MVKEQLRRVYCNKNGILLIVKENIPYDEACAMCIKYNLQYDVCGAMFHEGMSQKNRVDDHKEGDSHAPPSSNSQEAV